MTSDSIRPRFPSARRIGHNLLTMNIDSRDSDTLKPPELDELGQILTATGLGLEDAEIDTQVEAFPLVVTTTAEEELDAFLFASLERIGGTPCVLWGLGSVRPGRAAKKLLSGMAAELYRRAAITFPDEDVLVGGRFATPSAYGLLDSLADRVPRPDYRATGEERAWGRRLAKRFGCEEEYDDRAFRIESRRRPWSVDSTAALNGVAPKIAGSLFDEVDGTALIAFAWALAEDLAARLD